MKKVRKALPPGISDHDAKILTKVKRRAYRLDMSLFSCCGIRFGWSSVIGFVPAIGDVLDAFMAMMVFRTCQQVDGGLPASVRSKMMFNIIFDFFIGLVPFVGDLADAMFRANTKNAAELEKFLRGKGVKNLRMSGLPKPLVDPSDPDEFERYMSSNSPPEYVDERPQRQQPMQASRPARAEGAVPQTTTTTTTTNGSGGGWFGFGRKKRQPDVERGNLAGAAPGYRSGEQPLPDVPMTAQSSGTMRNGNRH